MNDLLFGTAERRLPISSLYILAKFSHRPEFAPEPVTLRNWPLLAPIFREKDKKRKKGDCPIFCIFCPFFLNPYPLPWITQ